MKSDSLLSLVFLSLACLPWDSAPAQADFWRPTNGPLTLGGGACPLVENVLLEADHRQQRGAYGPHSPNHTIYTPTTGSAGDSAVTVWTANYASGLVSFDDQGNDLATDATGNIYVTGSNRDDYLTIKYDSSGAEEWVARYDGPGNSHDKATAIAVDDSGSVYVTGLSTSSGGDYDYATIKYDASGTEQWVALYNGPTNSEDAASAIAVDASGNVYVTGASDGLDMFIDYATVKYDLSGAEQWVARYNAGYDDGATAIVLDASGNVYVTGSSYGLGTSADYATVKYDLSGAEQWVTRFDGPVNAADYATAIAIDASGNVYVTGESNSSGTSYDYATVKYDPSGTEQWVTRYDGPGNASDYAGAIAVNASGNVYVTGLSFGLGTGADFATVKYDPSGTEQWVSRYNGPGNASDYAGAIAVNASGNVYVTGVSYGLGTSADYAAVKYDASGTEQWVARYDGPGNYDDVASAIALDASGNVYVTGKSAASSTSPYNFDYATVKYDPSGAEQWVARYIAPGFSFEEAVAIAVDASGNVCVTGSSDGYGTFIDFATVKYNASGTEQWVARYDGPGNDNDVPSAIALDASGNVYVTGTSDGLYAPSDYVTVKYDASGTEQWVSRYNGPGNYDDVASAIAVDASGNVYVTGSSYGLGTFDDYATVKYDASGAEQWVARYDAGYDDYASAIVLDASGNVYVTGGSRSHYATVKYTSSGVQEWVARYGGPGFVDEPSAIAVDASGNVYVTGHSYGEMFFEYATVKYNALGAEVWVARYHESGGAVAVAVDVSGNVYVTGECYSSSTSHDYVTVKYNAAGIYQWVARYDGPGNSDDAASAMALDVSGNVYVTGESYGSGTDYDYSTVKYDPSGAEQWVTRHNGPANSDDAATAIALDASGNVYVTGSTAFAAGTQYTTIKYRQTTTGVVSDIEIPQKLVLHQNYPNPFNPTTTIRFSIPTAGDASLKIFNLLGEEVATLASGEMAAGTHAIQWDATGQPSGVYFYRLQAGEFTETRKLVLLR